MRRLHLKLFYLRTRYKREAQGVTARTLGVRPATMSHLEQGRSKPTLEMLMALCKHYDVTPTYLLDDDRPIAPTTRDRWSERDAVIARNNWLEVPEEMRVRAKDGTNLVQVLPGARFYDNNAQPKRVLCASVEDARQLEEELQQEGRLRDKELEDALQAELMGQRKPRRAARKRAPAKAPNGANGETGVTSANVANSVDGGNGVNGINGHREAGAV